MDLKKLKEILKIVEKTDFQEVEIVEKDWRLRVGRNIQQQPMISYSTPMMQHMSSPQNSQTPLGDSQKIPDAPNAPIEVKGHVISSPFVGTFYRAPSPDAASFVEVGQRVQKGQTICIVEAMKLMNEIESDFDGTIAEIYAVNGRPVEFGEKLFRVEP